MENIKKTMLEELSNVKDLKNLNDLKVKYLGKKGIITELYGKMKEIPNEEKKEYGRKNNTNNYQKNKEAKRWLLKNKNFRTTNSIINIKMKVILFYITVMLI